MTLKLSWYNKCWHSVKVESISITWTCFTFSIVSATWAYWNVPQDDNVTMGLMACRTAEVSASLVASCWGWGRWGWGCYLAGLVRPRRQQCTTAASASAAPSACSTLGWGWGWCWGWGGRWEGCHLPPLPSRLCPLPWPWAGDSRCAGFHSTSAL